MYFQSSFCESKKEGGAYFIDRTISATVPINFHLGEEHTYVCIYLVPFCLFIPYILFPYHKTGAEGGSEDNTVSKRVWSLSTQCLESRAGAEV